MWGRRRGLGVVPILLRHLRQPLRLGSGTRGVWGRTLSFLGCQFICVLPLPEAVLSRSFSGHFPESQDFFIYFFILCNSLIASNLSLPTWVTDLQASYLLLIPFPWSLCSRRCQCFSTLADTVCTLRSSVWPQGLCSPWEMTRCGVCTFWVCDSKEKGSLHPPSLF